MAERQTNSNNQPIEPWAGHDNPANRSYTGLPSVVTYVDGNPVYAYGHVFVYGVSPDLEPAAMMQEGNERQRTRIRPKKVWEITENGIGSMLQWMPRLPASDVTPYLAINLIDGDPDTCWCSKGQGQPDVEPAWIRLDLPRETALREIVLVPRHDGQGTPRHLTIKVSQDGWHWTTIYDGDDTASLMSGSATHYSLPGLMQVKQVWIIGNDLPVACPGPGAEWTSEHCFFLSQVQAIDEHGENVALVSRGAAVTVSSTNYGQGSTWDVYDLLWPLQYDLGMKWIRLSGSNYPFYHDTLSWRFVEQKKGKYVIDEKSDRVITEAAQNGCKLMVQLTYGNWLYTPEPEKESWDIRRYPRPFPPAPFTRQMIDGYKNWVRFMVQHFKGRIACWEIYNEPVIFGFQRIEDYPESVKAYCDLVKEVAPVIRETDPDALISLAGMAGWPGLTQPPWLNDVLEHDVVRLVDVVGWHIQTTVMPELPHFAAYPACIRDFQHAASAWGFKGIWQATESWWSAPYPPFSQISRHLSLPCTTEIRKAKDMARTYVMNSGLGVMSFWCNTWYDYLQTGSGMLRNTFSADPISPTQPEPIYYVMRTLCTVMDGANPAQVNVELTEKSHRYHAWSFDLPGNDVLVGVYLLGASVDVHPGASTAVAVDGIKAEQVIGIDMLNGMEQELEFEQHEGWLLIPRLLVRDYPLMLRLCRVA